MNLASTTQKRLLMETMLLSTGTEKKEKKALKAFWSDARLVNLSMRGEVDWIHPILRMTIAFFEKHSFFLVALFMFVSFNCDSNYDIIYSRTR